MAPKAQVAQGGSSLDRAHPMVKVALGLFFVGLIGIAYFIIFYDELSQQIAGARAKEQQLRADLVAAQDSKIAYQKDLEEKIKREQVGREQKKVLPDESETPAFLSSLQGAAIVAGVNFTSWSPTEEVPQEFYAKVPMKVTLTGKFHQVAKFFYGVGQIDRIINIENIQMKIVPLASSRDKTKTTESEVNVECLATAFRALGLNDQGASKRRGKGK